MSNWHWQPLAAIRGTDVTAKLAAERAPRWAADYIARLERKLDEARAIADELSITIEPAPGVIELVDRYSGATVRFRPGATVHIYTAAADNHRSRFQLRASRTDPHQIEIAAPDSRRLAALGTGGVNVLTIRALED